MRAFRRLIEAIEAEGSAPARWVLALALAWLPSAAILYFAEGLARLLGRRVLGALERLMGMILTTLATQMLLAGLTEYLRMIGIVAR